LGRAVAAADEIFCPLPRSNVAPGFLLAALRVKKGGRREIGCDMRSRTAI